jgi:hypothetical protein
VPRPKIISRIKVQKNLCRTSRTNPPPRAQYAGASIPLRFGKRAERPMVWTLQSLSRRATLRRLPCGQPIDRLPLFGPWRGPGDGTLSRMGCGGTPPKRPKRAPPQLPSGLDVIFYPAWTLRPLLPLPLTRASVTSGPVAAWGATVPLAQELAAMSMAPSGSSGPSLAATLYL